MTIRVRADKLVHPEPHLVKSSAYIATLVTCSGREGGASNQPLSAPSVSSLQVASASSAVEIRTYN